MRTANRNDRGSVLMIVVILMIVILGMTAAFLTVASAHKSATLTGQQLDHATAVAEAGLDDTIYKMNAWTAGTLAWPGAPVPANTGSVSTGAYSVTIEPPFDRAVVQDYTLRVTGTIGKNSKGITDIVKGVYSGIFQYGLFSDQTLSVSANAMSDSYDSGAGTYASQAVNGRFPNLYARSNGTVGSNNNVALAGNITIHGSATPGPGSSTTMGPGTTVSGSTAPLTAPVPFPPIVVPAVGPGISYTVPPRGSYTIAGPGTVHYTSLTTLSNSTLTINGPITIVLDSLVMDSNTTFTINTGAGFGPVKLYGTGTFDMKSNNALGPSSGIPADLQVYVTTNNLPSGTPVVGCHSNTSFTGAWYAPNAQVTLASNTAYYGSVVGKLLPPASNFSIHYDEALARVGGAPKYKTKLWFDTDR